MRNKLSRVGGQRELKSFNPPAELQDLFDKPPLLRHEDPKLYQGLLTQLAATVHPTDVIEWLWFKDIADLNWEIIRFRQLKAALLDAGRQKAIEHFVCTISAPGPLVAFGRLAEGSEAGEGMVHRRKKQGTRQSAAGEART